MVVATVPQPYEAPLRPQLTGTTVAPTGGATDRRRLGGCHDPSPKNDGCGACSHSYSLHRPWANTAASRPSNAAATSRDAATATRVDPSLAPVARSLAMEWSALGLGPGEMATVARHPHRHRYRDRPSPEPPSPPRALEDRTAAARWGPVWRTALGRPESRRRKGTDCALPHTPCPCCCRRASWSALRCWRA